MKYFSVFSGVEGIGQGLNGEPVGFSEIDKYASMVLKYHYPNIKNYGDITKISWNKVPDFDVLVGGSPCQDFSIAGKRKGLRGARSSLAWEFIRGLRDKQPRSFIWENVKGVMSSRGGWDFANLLCAFSESGYDLWWQILNAKDFGVAQNRERIFVIGTRAGSLKEIFFEREDSQKDIVIPTLTSRYYGGQANGAYIRNTPQQIIGGSQGHRVYDTDGTSITISSGGGGLGAKTGLYAFKTNTKLGYDLAKEGDGINLSFPESKTRRGRVIKNKSPTLQVAGQIGTIQDTKIRRLTPKECERLMNWPDDWTRWGINEKGETVEMSDNQRYKMCGNGVVSAVIKELQKELTF